MLAAAVLASAAAWASTQKEEEELGRKYSLEVEQEAKLSTDKALIERTERIGEALAKVANEHEVAAGYGRSEIYKFDYQFKVIEDKDVNAFSLPGGHIYVNTGLLEACDTDDELAGVLAHEIAHASHHHLVQLVDKQSKFDRYIALIALAGVLANMRSSDLNNLLVGAQLLRTGKLSGFTQEAEVDADRTAVAYLARSTYNPEGMVAFMKKLEVIQQEQPGVTLGIYQTHPATFRRVVSIAKGMQEEGIKVDMRKVRDVAYAKAVPEAEDSTLYKVTIGEKTVWEPADLAAGSKSKERAEAAAAKLNSLLDTGLATKDICVDSEGRCLIVKGETFIRVEPEDEKATNQTDRTLLDRARSAIKYAIWAEWLCVDCKAAQEEELTP